MSDGPDKTDELYPIAVLIDELKVRGQIAAIKTVLGLYRYLLYL
jgi:hypothetical protein